MDTILSPGNNPSSFAGISSTKVWITGSLLTDGVPWFQATPVKIINARRIFIITPALITQIWAHTGLLMSSSGLYSIVPSKLSSIIPAIFT